MRVAARTFREKVAMVSARRRATALERPPGLEATTVRPGLILHFLSKLREDYGLYKNEALHSARHLALRVKRPVVLDRIESLVSK